MAQTPGKLPPHSAIPREHVLAAITELIAGVTHAYGPSTIYDLIYEGKRYPPKAVVGLAYRQLTGSFPNYLLGGEGKGGTNDVLKKLGFTVVSKVPPQIISPPIGNWSKDEVKLIVADYFLMLREELERHPYSKKAHRTAILPGLQGRSDGSVEFKHQNLSGVLLHLGLPYIAGYKPRFNYQALLRIEAQKYLEAHPHFFDGLETGPVIDPNETRIIELPSLQDVFDSAPEAILAAASASEPWKSRMGRRCDFVRRDAENRRLGRLGEKFTVNVERKRLATAGRDDLAAKVEWVAETCGDGLGFDVLSFSDKDESELYVEVKTTGLGKDWPFIVIANEVRCSKAEPMKLHLYRVFEYSKRPRIYTLPGSLKATCQLAPLAFRAMFGRRGSAELPDGRCSTLETEDIGTMHMRQEARQMQQDHLVAHHFPFYKVAERPCERRLAGICSTVGLRRIRKHRKSAFTHLPNGHKRKIQIRVARVIEATVSVQALARHSLQSDSKARSAGDAVEKSPRTVPCILSVDS